MPTNRQASHITIQSDNIISSQHKPTLSTNNIELAVDNNVTRQALIALHPKQNVGRIILNDDADEVKFLMVFQFSKNQDVKRTFSTRVDRRRVKEQGEGT